nr:UBN2_2 domain-containing protein [Tanacetum cinerariifolium]
MIIKNSISVAIRGGIPDSENEKKYLSSVEEQFKGTSKAHASTLILKMFTTKYDGVSGVHEHIMLMSDMANKLKAMDMEINEESGMPPRMATDIEFLMIMSDIRCMNCDPKSYIKITSMFKRSLEYIDTVPK